MAIAQPLSPMFHSGALSRERLGPIFMGLILNKTIIYHHIREQPIVNQVQALINYGDLCKHAQ